ncbi:MAG: hypothetical protein MJ053_05850, partial [Elusimicrobiaceae bacterium]|nr:hypothetical protein [Elusimicrobiaceae bacterium]
MKHTVKIVVTTVLVAIATTPGLAQGRLIKNAVVPALGKKSTAVASGDLATSVRRSAAKTRLNSIIKRLSMDMRMPVGGQVSELSFT